MQNVVLVVHLILALALIATVLLQRSEGGGLGMGGGGGASAGRSSLTGVAKLTWGLAVAFIATSITLTIIAAQNSATTSVLDRVTDVPVAPPVVESQLPAGEDLLPPGDGLAPAQPPRAD